MSSSLLFTSWANNQTSKQQVNLQQVIQRSSCIVELGFGRWSSHVLDTEVLSVSPGSCARGAFPTDPAQPGPGQGTSVRGSQVSFQTLERPLRADSNARTDSQVTPTKYHTSRAYHSAHCPSCALFGIQYADCSCCCHCGRLAQENAGACGESLAPLCSNKVRGQSIDCCCRQLGPVVRSLHAAAGAGSGGLAVSLLEQFIDYNTACAPALRIKGLAPATGEAMKSVNKTPESRPVEADQFSKVPKSLPGHEASIAASESVIARDDFCPGQIVWQGSQA